MDSAFDYIIIGLIIIGVLFLIKPEWYDATAGKVIDAGKEKLTENITETAPPLVQDHGLAYYYDNFSFIKCVDSSICQRLYGSSSQCNVTSGHCFKYI